MKKLLAGLAAVAALSSTAALADTPTVRELNDFSHIVSVASKNREATKPSEFVIYHQDSHRPCPPDHEHAHEHGKMMHHHHGKPEHKGEHKGEHKHEHKHAGEHHHHHHHHDDMKKDKDANKVEKKPAVSEQDQKSGDQ